MSNKSKNKNSEKSYLLLLPERKKKRLFATIGLSSGPTLT